MTTSVEPSASAEPGLLGPRITGRLLARLAARAVTAGPRESVPIEMPATGGILGHVPRGTPDGLNFSVWTRDVRRGRQIASRLEAGSVNVNEAYAAAWGSVDAPMGGWKDSGVGSRHGEHGMLKYTDAQTISVQRLVPIAPPGAMPPAMYARAMTAAMRALQRLPGRK